MEMIYALIVAGGRGTRFAGPTPKQYLPLAGVPILMRTLAVFDACDAVERLVVVLPQDDIPAVTEDMIRPFGLRKEVAVVAGGGQRQESVFNGLTAIPEEASVVVIHDAVRPLVRLSCIIACIEAARRFGAAIAALPATDTLKRVNASGVIEGTLSRDEVWLAQTPQAFRADLIRRAHAHARAGGYTATDDASLVERLGHPVRIVPGQRSNLKITTPEDLASAETILLAQASPGND